MKLKLYTDRNVLPEGRKYTSLLFPFWGNPETDRNDTDFGRFDEYTRQGKEVFELVEDIAAADYLLLPYEFSFEPEDMLIAARMDELAGRHGKKVLVFFNSDSNQEIPMKHAVVFRTSFFLSARRSNEFAFPGWSVDFRKLKSVPPLGSKPAKASVSYCGYVDYLSAGERFTLDNIVKQIRGRSNSADRIGPALRGKAVRALLNDDRIESNFIIRSGFWAPGMDKIKARMEYMDNILDSGYALVARGAGNFSYRLLEVLSCGRIPVFINTDCVLPFHQYIDWQKHVVWLEEKDIARIADRLDEFHRSLSDSDYTELGINNRCLYEQWLSPLGYYRNLHKYLN